jgi:Asp-tRNA(Asn)/Glu-tRNA(Gln) amidotransferase A subunit family amidase
MTTGGEVSPVEGLDAFIDRIERIDPTNNALAVTCFDEAWEAARTSEAGLLIHLRELRALEGAVICGKTNTSEFGAGNNTTNPIFGTTVNPFDASRTSRGSSGRAAAALATNMIAVATGSGTGGSLRVPATSCGVLSLKPGPGLIPYERPSSLLVLSA